MALIIRSLGNMVIKERLEELEQRREECRAAGLITVFEYLKCGNIEDRDRLFSVFTGDLTRSNGFKFQQGKFRFDIRKNFLIMRVLKHWSRVPREVLEYPSLDTFKSSLKRHLTGTV